MFYNDDYEYCYYCANNKQILSQIEVQLLLINNKHAQRLDVSQPSSSEC